MTREMGAISVAVLCGICCTVDLFLSLDPKQKQHR